MADMIWEVGESFVYPADQMNVVVGEGAEGMALRADQRDCPSLECSVA
jgi:hypothetical protein